MCFLLPVWLMTRFQSKKKFPMLAVKIHFHSKWVSLFSFKAECPTLSLDFCFLPLPWKDLPKFYQKCSFLYRKPGQFPFFSCSLKHLFKNTILLSILWQCWISAFLQRTLKHVFPSSLLLLLLAPARTGWLVTNLMSLSQWLLCNTVSQEFGLTGRHCPR